MSARSVGVEGRRCAPNAESGAKSKERDVSAQEVPFGGLALASRLPVRFERGGWRRPERRTMKSCPVLSCAVAMLIPSPADAQGGVPFPPTIPTSTSPPFQGPASYFDEIRVNRSGESSCGSATCVDDFNFTVPTGYAGAAVFIADFMVQDLGQVAAPLRRVAAGISNVVYLSSTGNLSFDVTVTLDGGTPRSLEWTLAAAVLLYQDTVSVSNPVSLSCDSNSDTSCDATGLAFVPPGYSFVTYLPVELSWQFAAPTSC